MSLSLSVPPPPHHPLLSLSLPPSLSQNHYKYYRAIHIFWRRGVKKKKWWGRGVKKKKSKQGCNFTGKLTSSKHRLKLCLILNQAFTLYTNSGQTIPKLLLNTSQLKNSVKLLMSIPQTLYRSEWAKHATSWLASGITSLAICLNCQSAGDILSSVLNRILAHFIRDFMTFSWSSWTLTGFWRILSILSRKIHQVNKSICIHDDDDDDE